MVTSLRQMVLRFLTLGVMSSALVYGCATGEADPDAASGGSDPGVGGVGGTAAGQGGSSPCEQDCSAIVAPDCNVAVCNDGSYPGGVGDCVVVAAEDGTACDDGAFCTVDDSCQGGTCVGGPTNDCGMAPGDCEVVACDEEADSCVIEAGMEGMACTPSDDLCVEGATCSNGVCAGGSTKDCFLEPVPSDCYVSVCNPVNGMCEPQIGNEGEPCTDPMDLCTVDKTCASGQCVGGSPKDCSQLTAGCNMGVCDTGTGQCTTMAVGEGMSCDDLDGCTLGETCTMGVCGGGTPNMTCDPNAPDGCCPNICDATNDFDCNCPGEFVGGTCVYVPNIGAQYASQTAAQTACQGLGAGWDLCSPTDLCQVGTYTYLDMAGCDCTGGSATCNCGGINLYFHVTGAQSPYYVRQPEIAGCSSSAQCTDSVSETCGNAICCK